MPRSTAIADAGAVAPPLLLSPRPPSAVRVDARVAAYAEWIGLDLRANPRLAWLAERGLRAPLPSGWEKEATDQKGVVYRNTVTGEKSWDHPLDPSFRAIAAALQEAVVRERCLAETGVQAEGQEEEEEEEKDAAVDEEEGAALRRVAEAFRLRFAEQKRRHLQAVASMDAAGTALCEQQQQQQNTQLRSPLPKRPVWSPLPYLVVLTLHVAVSFAVVFFLGSRGGAVPPSPPPPPPPPPPFLPAWVWSWYQPDFIE